MEFCELMSKLEIASYPERFKTCYEALDKKDDEALYNEEYIREIDKKYDLLGEYLEPVLKGCEDIKNKPELVLFGRAAVEYNKGSSSYESRQLKLPKNDGTPATDMLPVLILLAEVPDMVKRYAARGFDEAEIKKNLENIKINIWVLDLLSKRPMLDQGHYNWICHYTKAMIFDHKAFNFQPAVWGMNAIYLKNKKTGEILPMMTSGKFHRSGLVLGSAGCEDEEGSFDAGFTEVTDQFIGHLVRGGRVEAKLSVLKKSEWECILRPGDDVVSLHIPRNANLDPEYVKESIREGFELSRKFYPECNFKYVVCYSWLLEPKLVDILGEEAKLSKFVQLFTKHPIYSYGTSCLGYVFPGYQSGPVLDFPENTTLQRGIKKLMLDGDYIYGAAGVIFEL